jgi:WD40 repeat protein
VSVTLDRVLAQRGHSTDLGAYVVGCGFARGVAGFALGDGSVRLGAEWHSFPVHDGAALAFQPDGAGGFVSGGDDGVFARIGRDGTVTVLARYGMKWVEQVASFRDDKTALLACAVGRNVHLFDGTGAPIKTLPHPSTVTGIAFDAKGKRVAASHYGGASLWFVASKTDNPRKLDWKGSHTGIAISPDGDAVVTAMQENALHGWRLSDGQHMRMSGYPGKTRSLSFSRGGKWLASSGADAIVLWPFFGGGPMGKAPMELAGAGPGVLCTAVACNSRNEAVAAGFSDGLVALADTSTQRVLPVCGPGRGSVSCLAWNEEGGQLAFGTETGFAAIVDFTAGA